MWVMSIVASVRRMLCVSSRIFLSSFSIKNANNIFNNFLNSQSFVL